ncbi:MAG: DNA-binding protein [Verrucomicrobiales bacterium]|nr:DNA-binding protein [Verrucomicrobiales bacterium]|tara:strand:- start:494 stop:985 length:492 start_codon:yes stop_codon:yes gene_type:complete
MSKRATVYLETTIPSYLAARPSSNSIIAGRQELTRQWWQHRRGDFNFCISEFVLTEVAMGDPEAAARRSKILEGIDLLEIDEEVLRLAQTLLSAGIVPTSAAADAAHIAVAARHGMDFLVTWNCAHIANAEILGRMNFAVSKAGHCLPIICTPDELFGEPTNE